MKRSREELNKYFEECLVKYVGDYDAQKEIISICFNKYKMPFFRTQTILKLDASTVELKDHEIFWILSAIKTNNKSAKIKIEDYFTDIEIAEYSKLKQKTNDVEFPIVLPMFKVSDNQWIGTIKASELIKWRGSILKYNKNIQRRLHTVVRGNKTYEAISINKRAVTEMVQLFKQRKFIPNVITLNIDDTSDFYYDEEKMELVINDIDSFDLTDGYHRLIALSKVSEEDPSFDYEMELRITCFSDDLANHFIWQEEQRTIMPKKAIKSYNMDDISNKITKRINESSSCNLSGNINRGGMIDFSVFADMIDECFVNKLPEKDKKLALTKVPKDVIESINIITENNPDIMNKSMTVAEIRILVYVCAKYFAKDKSDIYEAYDKLINYPFIKNQKDSLSSAKERYVVKLLDSLL